MIPGVNISSNDFLHYFLALFFSAIIHEFGHGICAVSEDVELRGFGIIFFVFLPGAYADLNGEDLETLRPQRQLNIFSAGVWNNFFSVIFVLVFLFLFSSLLFPFYSAGEGIVVLNASPESGASHVFDNYPLVTSVNNFPMKSIHDWNFFFSSYFQEKSGYTPNYCTSQQIIDQNKDSKIFFFIFFF